ncbi:MAG: fatty acid kinase fatty acid binding subunit [Pseudonocardiales bacterium]|jgi:DegV family protein with EDD domain|nr:fatty acid kinase fatty acid binding subunit [Pseudonocardiales bacterium]
MTQRVAVVTDSTAYLPEGTAERLGIGVVPLRVQLGPRTATDGFDVTPDQVASALRNKVAVTTSRPTPAEFATLFGSCLDAGAERVVSIHLAAALSGTWESAVLAAQDFPHGVVRVVDSRATAGALGFAVTAAASLAREGASAAEVQGAATDVVDRTRTMFYVDTLEYLRRGGRIGTASALLATSLSVKPLLQMVEGRIVPLEKVRTASKAIARLTQLTVEAAGEGPVDIAVHHLAAAPRAQLVAAQLRTALPRLRALHLAELGPVIAAHLGPGVIGTVIVRH